jgi:hypothetical protein
MALRRKKLDKTVVAALIAAAATITVTLITAMSPPLQEWWKNKLSPPSKPVPVADTKSDPPKKKTKSGYCQEDPISKVKYIQNITPFNPHDHMVVPLVELGGDSVNRGHKWQVTWEAPGLVYDAKCAHAGTHEEIVLCGPESPNSKTAIIMGWVNGDGGTQRCRFSTRCRAKCRMMAIEKS